MKRKTVRWLFLFLSVTVLVAIIVTNIVPDSGASAENNSSCNRIISAAPSITETLFALGLGDAVLGVTSHSDYPPEAVQLPVVGTYTDIHLEQLVTLRPDTVVVLREQKKLIRSLEKMGVSIIVVNQHTAPGLLRSFRTIGKQCGVNAAASTIIDKIHNGLKRVTQECEFAEPLRTMVVVGRCLSCDGIRDVFAAGGRGFYEQLIHAAGGENIFRDATQAFPSVGVESIIAADPEVIIDIIPADLTDTEKQRHRETWGELRTVSAVKNDRVYVVTRRFMLRPGPDIVRAAELMCNLLRKAGGDD